MLSALQNIQDHTHKLQETTLQSLANPCPFCNKRLAKYLCPQCKRGYCTVTCFQSRAHEVCSEAFSRDQGNERGGQGGGVGGMREMLWRQGFDAPERGGGLEFVGDLERDGGDGSGETDEEENGDEEDGEEYEETERRRKDLEIRMMGINIEEADFEEIWDRLDPREREEFVLLAQELEKEEKQGTKLQD